MRKDAWAVAASGLVGLEGLALLMLSIWMATSLFGGAASDAATAGALLVMTVAAAAALIAFAAAILREQGWGRSGAIVVQLLVLSVAVGAATGAYAHPLVGAGLGAPALLALACLITAARSAARREAERPDESAAG